MNLANRKDAEQTIKIVRELAPANRNGVEVELLRARLGVSPGRIESLLEKQPDYFVRVGDQSRYRLNRFGRVKGLAEDIIADVERSFERGAQIRTSLILVVMAAIVVVAGVLLSG